MDLASRDNSPSAKVLQSQSAYCLMCIHKQLGDESEVTALSKEHFTL